MRFFPRGRWRKIIVNIIIRRRRRIVVIIIISVGNIQRILKNDNHREEKK